MTDNRDLSGSKAFEKYVLSGRFNKVASKAVADAIAETRALGLPMEGLYREMPPSAKPTTTVDSQKKTLPAASEASAPKRAIA